MTSDTKGWLIFAGYVAAMTLTYGHAYHSTCIDWDKGPEISTIDRHGNIGTVRGEQPMFGRNACSMALGAVWPVYVLTSFGAWVMDPKRSWPTIRVE